MQRDLKLDNLRGLAITLIVMVHFIATTGFLSTTGFNLAYKFIYLFHLPLLIFVSGYLSKDNPESSIKAFKTILIPYFIFTTLWMIFAFLKDGTIYEDMYFMPVVGLWYLLSLYFWRVFLPTATKIKYIFTLSIVLALVMGTIELVPGFLSITRTITYFPIFLLGFYFKDIKEKFAINKYLSLGILITILTATTFCLIPYKINVLILKYSYLDLDMGNLKGMAIRLLILVVGMISVILLYNIMTSQKTFLTKIGKNSLPVYVLQFYFTLTLPDILKYIGLGYIFDSYFLSIIYVIVATTFVTYILSRDKVNESINVMIKYTTKILIKENLDVPKPKEN